MSVHEEEAAMNTKLSIRLFNNVERYESLMQVVRNRMTNRAFAPYACRASISR